MIVSNIVYIMFCMFQENGDINDENAEEKIDNVAAIAESIQPKGNTLSSTCVRCIMSNFVVFLSMISVL